MWNREVRNKRLGDEIKNCGYQNNITKFDNKREKGQAELGKIKSLLRRDNPIECAVRSKSLGM